LSCPRHFSLPFFWVGLPSSWLKTREYRLSRPARLFFSLRYPPASGYPGWLLLLLDVVWYLARDWLWRLCVGEKTGGVQGISAFFFPFFSFFFCPLPPGPNELAHISTLLFVDCCLDGMELLRILVGIGNGTYGLMDMPVFCSFFVLGFCAMVCEVLPCIPSWRAWGA
jgi:hypothetical protein